MTESTTPESTTTPNHGVTPSLMLVSKSPRRRRLLQWLGLPYETAEVDIEEHFAEQPESARNRKPKTLVADIAYRKVLVARDMYPTSDSVTLCFDTLVCLDDEILGKPKNEADARATLKRLSGRKHIVVTGMAIWFPEDDVPLTGTVSTNVVMKELTDEDIDSWIARGEYMGCAGSYNIEAQIAYVADAECYQNVAGLPLCHLYRALRNRIPASTMLVSPCATCDTSLDRACLLGPKIVSFPKEDVTKATTK